MEKKKRSYLLRPKQLNCHLGRCRKVAQVPHQENNTMLGWLEMLESTSLVD